MEAVFVAADGLRPQTERAVRFAAAPGVVGNIGVFEIAAEVFLRVELFVERQHGRQQIHVHQNLAFRIVHDRAILGSIGHAFDRGPVLAFGDFLDGEFVFVARDKIDRRAGLEALLGLDRDLGADEPDDRRRIEFADHPGGFDVGLERRRGGMDDDELVRLHVLDDVGEFQSMRRRVDQLGAFDHRSGLGQPSRIPKRFDLALHLIARTGPTVVPVE